MYIIDLLTNGGGAVTKEGFLNVVAFIVALLFALILHEIAHGVAALSFGDRTALNSGRLSINPAKHFDWIGLLMMLLCGFGWAKPVPVNVSNFKNQKAGMVVVSIAGVLTNLLLAFVFCGLQCLMTSSICAGLYANAEYLWYFLYVLGLLGTSLNVSFALFNILPFYPMDGYRLLSCFIRQENAFLTFLRKYSLYILIGLIVLGNVLPQISPLDLYLNWAGGGITSLYQSFWSLLFR